MNTELADNAISEIEPVFKDDNNNGKAI